MYVFCIKVELSILNLALISQIVKKGQTFTEIEDGGVGQFEFWEFQDSKTPKCGEGTVV